MLLTPRSPVHDSIPITGRDSILVAISFVFMLFRKVVNFGETLASRRPGKGLKEIKAPIPRHPDGRMILPQCPKTDGGPPSSP